jgi:hypothetical protein
MIGSSRARDGWTESVMTWEKKNLDAPPPKR